MITNKNKVIEKDLSYKIVGILFEVHRELGGSYPEKIYQKAVEKLLIKNNIKFTREVPAQLEFQGEKIGQYFLDFLIEDRVILELKTVVRFRPDNFKQILSYLVTTKKELGILVNFRGASLVFKRVLNAQKRNL